MATTSESQSCSICLEELGQNVNTLPCSHSFHPPCISAWALHNDNINIVTCPLCIQSVEYIVPIEILENFRRLQRENMMITIEELQDSHAYILNRLDYQDRTICLKAIIYVLGFIGILIIFFSFFRNPKN